ncbi:hypothetical protein E4U41_005185 [Claviceps citrina]|nr:hypothetical protein E4U41_005185 [Claviceps citrina]
MPARQDKCAAQGMQSCSAGGLPSAFCCETGRRCMLLAGGSTVMCCPSDSSCEAIRPITCDVGAQNPDANLMAPIKTLAQKSRLPRCAANGSCCPFGFTCADDGKLCLKDQDQSQTPDGYIAAANPASAAVPISTGTKASSAAAPATASATASASASETASEIASGTASATASATASVVPGHEVSSGSLGPGKTSIIGGVVGGVLALIFLAVVIFLCVRSRKRDASSVRSFPYSQSSGSGPHGHKISAPIANPETSYRTDFIRKTPSVQSSRPQSLASRFSRTPQLTHAPPPNPRLSIPNPFDSPTSSTHSPAASRYSVASDYGEVHTGQVGAKPKPIRALTPSAWRESRRISRRDVEGVRSSDGIGMFADANAANGRKGGQSNNRQTSFSDMMEEARMGDVHRGQPYVPGGTKRHVPGTTPRI